MSNDMTTAVQLAGHLPKRQREVLVCLAEGLLIKETSLKLGITENTVRNVRSTVYARLGVNNAVEAARVAFRAGLQ